MTARPIIFAARFFQRRRAFTLTELLVVIGIIVLMLVLALPTLSLLSGSRSIGGAQNQIAAALAVARTGAMGLAQGAGTPGGIANQSVNNFTETVEGIFFYVDPITGRRMMQLVQDRPDPLYPPPPAAGGGNYGYGTQQAQQYQFLQQNIDVWLDCVPNTEPIALPSGVGIAFVADVTSPYPNTNNQSAIPVNDRYIGFNIINNGVYNKVPGGNTAVTPARTNNDTNNTYGKTSATPAPGNGGVRWGNVVLFDTTGNLVSLRWGLRVTTTTAIQNGTTLNFQFTQMGRLLYGIPDANIKSTALLNSDMATYPDLIPRNPGYYPNSGSLFTVSNPGSVLPLRSALAFVLFDQPHYDAMNFAVDNISTDNDSSNGESNETIFNDPSKPYDDGTNPTSTKRMNWLDANTTALMINHFNATLIRAE
jgi:prepilin-type N-terminal cleavage/methylation domain-containing protein